MFSTLESTWDRSARRRWTTLASFGFQAMTLSLLLLIPLIWVQGPPKLQWIERWTVPAPRLATPEQPAGRGQSASFSNMSGVRVLLPTYIPRHVALVDDNGSLPPVIGNDAIGISDPTASRAGVLDSTGHALPTLIEKSPPAPTHPLRISHWSEGNLIYRVQPIYPPLARQARVQGQVELRAIISKAGTIENLVVLRGHPMLFPAAIDAVRHWRYRPYLLNGEPIEVETEITVNFVLGG
jgi:protein TonB